MRPAKAVMVDESPEHWKEARKRKRNCGPSLPTYVKMWPTPSSEPRGPHSGREVTKGGQTVSKNTGTAWGMTLETAVARAAPGGQLNPLWVEWLQGFPLGWTDLKHSETP